MNRRLMVIALACVALLSASGPAWSQGRIALMGSADGTVCSIQDAAPGIVEVHIFVFDVVGLAAIQFAAPIPACWSGATWIGDTIDTQVVVGNTQDPVLGVAIAWGDVAPCTSEGGGGLNSPVHVGTMMFSASGQATPCCAYPIVKASGDLHPEVDGPIVVLCSNMMEVAGVGVEAVINPEPNCSCLTPVPIEETTWGAVKALYR